MAGLVPVGGEDEARKVDERAGPVGVPLPGFGAGDADRGEAGQCGDGPDVGLAFGEEQDLATLEGGLSVVERDLGAGVAQELRAGAGVLAGAVVRVEAAVAHLDDAGGRHVGDGHAPPVAAGVVLPGFDVAQAEPVSGRCAQPAGGQKGMQLVPVLVVPGLPRFQRELLLGRWRH